MTIACKSVCVSVKSALVLSSSVEAKEIFCFLMRLSGSLSFGVSYFWPIYILFWQANIRQKRK